jgi:hypothetical protein
MDLNIVTVQDPPIAGGTGIRVTGWVKRPDFNPAIADAVVIDGGSVDRFNPQSHPVTTQRTHNMSPTSLCCGYSVEDVDEQVGSCPT